LTCWIYFNPKESNSNKPFVDSYEQSARYEHTLFDRGIVEDVDEDINHEAIDIGWDDNNFPTSETPTCIDCYNDVEYDGFSNYYCSSCGGWFKEDEVLKYQN